MKKKIVPCLFFFLLVSANQAVEGSNPEVSFSVLAPFPPCETVWRCLQMKQELPDWNIVGGILEHSAVQLTFELNIDVSAGILFEESPCCQEFLFWFIIIWKQTGALQIWYRVEHVYKQVTLIFWVNQSCEHYN